MQTKTGEQQTNRFNDKTQHRKTKVTKTTSENLHRNIQKQTGPVGQGSRPGPGIKLDRRPRFKITQTIQRANETRWSTGDTGEEAHGGQVQLIRLEGKHDDNQMNKTHGEQNFQNKTRNVTSKYEQLKTRTKSCAYHASMMNVHFHIAQQQSLVYVGDLQNAFQ